MDCRLFTIAVVLLPTAALVSTAEAAPPAAKPASQNAVPDESQNKLEVRRLFVEKVQPLLARKCLACHGEGAELGGGLDLRSRAAAIRGGESGLPGLTPGEPAKSQLYTACTGDDAELTMPPKAADRLTDEQLSALAAWIEGDAPWPDVAQQQALARVDETTARTTPGLTAGWNERRYRREDLWAYQPLRHVALPEPIGGASHPVDRFLNAQLRRVGLVPAAPADPQTWLRRVTLNLTGMLPTPAEAAELGAAPSPEARQRVLDRLLESPFYGEQQARRWLDLVRYADTGGYSIDLDRPHAWRYRDYVVRSFNADKPYHRFLTEQIAGDELDPADPECLIAAGFLRLGPWEHQSMAVAAESRQQLLDDMVSQVGSTFLALELSCCKCHDHKFDPLPTRDYYRFQAIFAPAQTADRPAEFLPGENVAIGHAERDRLQKILQTVRSDEAKKLGYAAKFRTERGARRCEALAFSVYNGATRVSDSRDLTDVYPCDVGDQVAAIRILQGGSLTRPGDEVTPGVFSVLLPENAPLTAADITTDRDGRRLQLAQWLTRPDHPLTARVIVNRVWQQHFGERPLAGDPNQFGVTGGKPSHPELLDWLAVWFVENGWSLKKLHRLIATSDAASRSSRHPQSARWREIDPGQTLLAAYPVRRLAAEEIHDNLLFVSGELNTTRGGPPYYPQISWEAATAPRTLMGGGDIPFRATPERNGRNRRAIYAVKQRNLPHPFLEVFNQPVSSLSCARREQSVVAPQAFALFNSQFAHARALALARRLQSQGSADMRVQIEQAFALLFGRAPEASELRACASHYERRLAVQRQTPPVRFDLPAWLKKVSGPEDDYAARYEPDLGPCDVDAETRALGELCLVLLNSSEFLYIR